MAVVVKEADCLEALELLSGRLGLPSPQDEWRAYVDRIQGGGGGGGETRPGGPIGGGGGGPSASSASLRPAAALMCGPPWFPPGSTHPLVRVDKALREGCSCQVWGVKLEEESAACLHPGRGGRRAAVAHGVVSRFLLPRYRSIEPYAGRHGHSSVSIAPPLPALPRPVLAGLRRVDVAAHGHAMRAPVLPGLHRSGPEALPPPDVQVRWAVGTSLTSPPSAASRRMTLLATLGTGQGVAATHVAELNPDII